MSYYDRAMKVRCPAPREWAVLDVVDEVDRSDQSYCFDSLIILKDQVTGLVYYATDSGCSCPSPYENVTNIADLTPITKGDSFEAFKRFVTGWRTEHYNDGAYFKQEDEDKLITLVKGLIG